jgi:putative ABC transport system permease protein
MKIWRELKYLVRKLNRRRAERELEEEIRTHMEFETREKIEAGLRPEDARDAARRAFGGVASAKERTRAVWGFGAIDAFRQDLRFSLRSFLKTPGFTFVALLTLALGIGANTAVFSVVNAVLLRPLPFPEPERLVTVLGHRTKTGLVGTSHSYLNFSDFRSQNTMFEMMTAFESGDSTLLIGQEPERIGGLTVSADFFRMWGAKMELGRDFIAGDEQPGNESVIISHALWQKRMNGSQDVIGRRILLNEKQMTVIGVTPAGFRFPFAPENASFYRTLNPNGGMETQRGANYLDVIGKLKPGVSLAQAEAEMRTIASSLEEQYKDLNAGKSVKLTPAHEQLVGDLRPALLILLGAVGFVLLIACANVANLQLARAAGRGRETAIRAALGASRGRIIRQLLTESLALSVLGGLLGIAVAVGFTEMIGRYVPEGVPRISETGIDKRVLLFSFALSIVTGALFGLAPALQGSRHELNDALKEGARSAAGGPARNRFRNALIIAELALSLTLLISAGLLINSFNRLRQASPGFNPQGLLTASVSLPDVRYPKDEQQVDFYRRAVERLSNLPGVESVGAIYPLPYGDGGLTVSFTVDGQPEPDRGARPRVAGRIITPDYIRSMRIPLLKGRLFTEKDDAAAPKVLLINETLAKRFFPDQNPLGRRLNVGLNDIKGEIVGVVGDVRDRALNRDPMPEFYTPYTQVPMGSMSFVARLRSGDPTALGAALRGAIGGIDLSLPVYHTRSMESRVSDSLVPQRFSMSLLTALAGLALVLAVVGVFSVMSFLASQRTHEIGVRTALGAQRGDILRLIIGQAMKLTMAGIAIGLALSFALTRLMKDALYQVTATDPATFLIVSLLLVGVALAACWLPARRASRVDPIQALRSE